jgi:hypothetical protein
MRIIQILLAALLVFLAIGIYVNRPPRYQVVDINGYMWRLDVKTGDVRMWFPDGKGGYRWIVPGE